MHLPHFFLHFMKNTWVDSLRCLLCRYKLGGQMPFCHNVLISFVSVPNSGIAESCRKCIFILKKSLYSYSVVILIYIHRNNNKGSPLSTVLPASVIYVFLGNSRFDMGWGSISFSFCYAFPCKQVIFYIVSYICCLLVFFWELFIEVHSHF